MCEGIPILQPTRFYPCLSGCVHFKAVQVLDVWENLFGIVFIKFMVYKLYKIYRTIILSVVFYGCETWSLTLREERKLRVFENIVLRRIFGPNRVS